MRACPPSRAGSPPTRIGVSVEPASAKALIRRLSEKVSRDPTPSVSHWSRKVRATRSATTSARQMACADRNGEVHASGQERRVGPCDSRSAVQRASAVLTDRATAGWFRSAGMQRDAHDRRAPLAAPAPLGHQHRAARPERRPRAPAQCRRRDAATAREVDRRLILGERVRQPRRCPAARPRA